jgi:hypothetical protein
MKEEKLFGKMGSAMLYKNRRGGSIATEPRPKTARKPSLVLVVECVICHHHWEVDETQKDQPVCPKCMGPGIPVVAKARL